MEAWKKGGSIVGLTHTGIARKGDLDRGLDLKCNDVGGGLTKKGGIWGPSFRNEYVFFSHVRDSGGPYIS